MQEKKGSDSVKETLQTRGSRVNPTTILFTPITAFTSAIIAISRVFSLSEPRFSLLATKIYLKEEMKELSKNKKA